jgi:hypothetical protein
MQINFSDFAGPSMGQRYEALVPAATGVSVVNAKPAPIAEFLAKGLVVGTAVISTLSPSGGASRDWYASATATFDARAYADFLTTRERPRTLTHTEQAVLHRALRRSTRIVHKAKRAEM